MIDMTNWAAGHGTLHCVGMTVTSMVGQSARIRGLPFAENMFSFTWSAGRIR